MMSVFESGVDLFSWRFEFW